MYLMLFFVKECLESYIYTKHKQTELYLCIQKMTVSHKNVNKSKRQTESVEEVQTMTKKKRRKEGMRREKEENWTIGYYDGIWPWALNLVCTPFSPLCLMHACIYHAHTHTIQSASRLPS